jgi:hypothetical protein
MGAQHCRYNRNATVTNSEFSFIGGNAVVAWGYTNETKYDRMRPGIELANYPKAGVDGTDGEHPRYTTIISNVAREVGLYEKYGARFRSEINLCSRTMRFDFQHMRMRGPIAAFPVGVSVLFLPVPAVYGSQQRREAEKHSPLTMDSATSTMDSVTTLKAILLLHPS